MQGLPDPASPGEGTPLPLTLHSTAVAMFLHQYCGPQTQGAEPRRSSLPGSQALIFCVAEEKGERERKKTSTRGL